MSHNQTVRINTDDSPKAPWRYKILAFFVSILGLVLLDILIRLVGLTPPEARLAIFLKDSPHTFSPFAESGDGLITIKSAWINRDEIYRAKKGKQPGRYFLLPGFRESRFTGSKSPQKIRIFALGGSTTFGQFVGAEAAFPEVLERMLSQLVTDREIEVINLGCQGLDSTRVRALLKEVLTFEPDLVVIYSGHNEMLKGDTASFSPSVAGDIKKRLLSVSTIFGWLNHFIMSLVGSGEYEILSEEAAALKLGAIPTCDQAKIPSEQQEPTSEEFVKAAASNYAENVSRMASMAREAGVAILFVLPVANPLWPPYISSDARIGDKAEELRSSLQKARDAFQRGGFEDAVAHADHAIDLAPVHAAAWYFRGIAHLNLGHREQAFADLQKAGELDVRPCRISSSLQRAIIGVMESSESGWIDLRPSFYGTDLSIQEMEALFVDHCHPSKAGHQIIAQRILPVALGMLEIAAPPNRSRIDAASPDIR